MLLHYLNMKLTNDITWRSFLKSYVLKEDKIKISKFDSFCCLNFIFYSKLSITRTSGFVSRWEYQMVDSMFSWNHAWNVFKF